MLKRKIRRNSEDSVLVVASKVKEYISSKGLRSSGELPLELSKKVKRILDEAIDRAKASKRETVQSRDV
jgi:histone H3/H4